MLDYLTNGDFTRLKNKMEYHRDEYHSNRESLKNCVQEAIDEIDRFNIISVNDTFDVSYYEYNTRMNIVGKITITSISDKQVSISGNIHKKGKYIGKCRLSKHKFYFNVIPELIQKIINRSKVIDDIL